MNRRVFTRSLFAAGIGVATIVNVPAAPVEPTREELLEFTLSYYETPFHEWYPRFLQLKVQWQYAVVQKVLRIPCPPPKNSVSYQSWMVEWVFAHRGYTNSVDSEAWLFYLND